VGITVGQYVTYFAKFKKAWTQIRGTFREIILSVCRMAQNLLETDNKTFTFPIYYVFLF